MNLAKGELDDDEDRSERVLFTLRHLLSRRPGQSVDGPAGPSWAPFMLQSADCLIGAIYVAGSTIDVPELLC